MSTYHLPCFLLLPVRLGQKYYWVLPILTSGGRFQSVLYEVIIVQLLYFVNLLYVTTQVVFDH